MSDNDLLRMNICKHCKLPIVFMTQDLVWRLAIRDTKASAHVHEPDLELRRRASERVAKVQMKGLDRPAQYSPPMLED